MKILVVFPSEVEARGFEPSNANVEVMISGIGGFATMYSLTKHCAQNKPDYIIHAGICGAFDTTLQLGEVVSVMIDHFADFGAMENGRWKTGFDLKLISSHKTPFTQCQLVAPQNDLAEIPKVIGVTSLTITSTQAQKELLTKQFDPGIESMEGAYVHYVCIKEDIPFVQLRAVSNYVGERDKSKWEIRLAVKNLHEQIEQVIETINEK